METDQEHESIPHSKNKNEFVMTHEIERETGSKQVGKTIVTMF
jgi:hypothetical protein